MTLPEIIHTLGLVLLCAVPLVFFIALGLGLCKAADDEYDDGQSFGGDYK
jgi:hypothetical protein